VRQALDDSRQSLATMSKFPLLADDAIGAQNAISDDSSDDGSKGAASGLSFGGSASSGDMQQFFQKMTASSTREARFFAKPPTPPSPHLGALSSSNAAHCQALEEDDDYAVAARGRHRPSLTVSVPQPRDERSAVAACLTPSMPAKSRPQAQAKGHGAPMDVVTTGPAQCCPGDNLAGDGHGVGGHARSAAEVGACDTADWGWVLAAESDPIWTHLREVTEIAIPVALGNLSEYMPLTFGMIMVGQLPEAGAELDAMAMANSYFNITGLAVQYGLNSALRTLCPQAVGSGRSRELNGVYVQRGALIALVALIPSFTLALYSERILVMLGQPQDLATLAQVAV